MTLRNDPFGTTYQTAEERLSDGPDEPLRRYYRWKRLRHALKEFAEDTWRIWDH